MGLKEEEAAKVNAIGDAIRALKQAKASKEVVMAEVRPQGVLPAGWTGIDDLLGSAPANHAE